MKVGKSCLMSLFKKYSPQCCHCHSNVLFIRHPPLHLTILKCAVVWCIGHKQEKTLNKTTLNMNIKLLNLA